MKTPARFFVPVIGAVVIAAVICGFLLWQVQRSAANLQKQVSRDLQTKQPSFLESILPADPSETADAVLVSLRTGDLFALRGEWKEAEAQYQDAVDAGGGVPALRKLAQAQLQRRKLDDVQGTVSKLEQAGARSEDLLLLKTIIAIRQGNLQEVTTLLQDAPDTPQRHYGIALLSLLKEDHVTARQELTQVQSGWEPVLRDYAATIMGAYNEYDQFPDESDVHLKALLARALAQVQECELGLQLLSEVVAKQDDYRDAWIVKGYCELQTERAQAALASLERAYTLDPEKPEIQYFLGLTYRALGDHQNAITFLQYSLKNGFTPESEVRMTIAREAELAGDTMLALEQYRALAVAEKATMEDVRAYVARAIEAGQKEDAYNIAKQATATWPDDALTFELLGDVSLSREQKEEAKIAYEKSLQLDPNNERVKQKLLQL